MADNPHPVTTREVDYASLVRKVLGKELNEKDIVYEFSDGREFEDSGRNGAFYTS